MTIFTVLKATNALACPVEIPVCAIAPNQLGMRLGTPGANALALPAELRRVAQVIRSRTATNASPS